MGRYLTRQTLLAAVLWGAAAAGVLYLVAGSAFNGGDDNGGNKQASVRPTSTLTRGASGSSDAIPTFTPTRVAATPTAGPTRQPDRTTCAAIRDTDYRSDTERAYFIANCSSTSNSGGGSQAATQQPAGGDGGAAAPTPPPTEVHHIIINDGGTLSPDIADSWTLSDDRFVLTLNLRDGLLLPNGNHLDAEALRQILEANRSAFETPFFSFFTAVNPTTLAIRALNKITPSFFMTLSAIEIVIKTP